MSIMKWLLFGVVCSEATGMEAAGDILVGLFSDLLPPEKQLLLETQFQEKVPLY